MAPPMIASSQPRNVRPRCHKRSSRVRGELPLIRLDPQWRCFFEDNTQVDLLENVEQMAATSKDPEIRRMLGTDKGLGAGMGVDDGFAVVIVKSLGNYGEIFERHLGPKTPIGLQRGLNRLWTQGGILFTPPPR